MSADELTPAVDPAVPTSPGPLIDEEIVWKAMSEAYTAGVQEASMYYMMRIEQERQYAAGGAVLMSLLSGWCIYWYHKSVVAQLLVTHCPRVQDAADAVKAATLIPKPKWRSVYGGTAALGIAWLVGLCWTSDHDVHPN